MLWTLRLHVTNTLQKTQSYTERFFWVSTFFDTRLRQTLFHRGSLLKIWTSMIYVTRNHTSCNTCAPLNKLLARGEHAEVLVTAPGFEMKTVRPDLDLSRLAAEIEEAEPGCPGYFYLQDAEYISLKQRFVEHIARGKTGTPEGCAGLDEAIEGLKLCDIVNDTVVSDLGV